MQNKNIKSFELEKFKALLGKLEAQQSIANDVFADIIYTALTKFSIDENDFRDTFGLTEGAVHRWSQLANLPQESIRPKIIGWIKENL